MPSAICHSAPPGKVGRRFTAVMDAEWQGMLNWKWNSKRPLIFAHVVLTKTLGTRKARDIRANIDRRLDLWNRWIHTSLVGYELSEGRSREGHTEKHKEEED